MRLHIGGVRGSSPVGKGEFLKFGGDTTSFMVEGRDGELLLLDAGTGIGSFVPMLKGRQEAVLLFTHYHLDHIIGFPLLPVIYDRKFCLKIYAPLLGEGWAASQALARVATAPVWPEASWSAAVKFYPLSGKPLVYGSLKITSCPINHPGGCLAYAVEDLASGGVFILATDIEWGRSSLEERERFYHFSRSFGRGQKLLLFDSHFLPADYERHKGWGHSTWREAVAVAETVAASRLLAIHHNPNYNDDVLLATENELQRLFSNGSLARQGMVVEL